MDAIRIPECKIYSKYGHYEAVDQFGRIICTGDTWQEVENDIIDMIKSMIGWEQHENSNSTAARTSHASAS